MPDRPYGEARVYHDAPYDGRDLIETDHINRRHEIHFFWDTPAEKLAEEAVNAGRREMARRLGLSVYEINPAPNRQKSPPPKARW